MESDNSANPFKARKLETSAPMRVLHRFTKPGHSAEIRERTVTQFAGLEFIVFLDGSLLESQLFHGARLAEYPNELQMRIRQFTDGGWSESPNEARN